MFCDNRWVGFGGLNTQQFILFLDKKVKTFLWRRFTPPRLRRDKKSMDNILDGFAVGPHSAAP